MQPSSILVLPLHTTPVEGRAHIVKQEWYLHYLKFKKISYPIAPTIRELSRTPKHSCKDSPQACQQCKYQGELQSLIQGIMDTRE